MQEPNFRLSVSKSKSFNQCKKQFNFNYNLKLPTKTMFYHQVGKFLHLTLEHFYNSYINGSNLPYHLVMGDSYKKALIEYKDKLTPEQKQECYEMINGYLTWLNNTPEQDPKMALACEKNFRINLNDVVLLNGSIDLVMNSSDNTLHILDYKSSKSISFLSKDLFQLQTYAYALWNENNNIEKVKASYICLRHNMKLITKEFNLKEILEIKDIYLKYSNEIVNEQEFKATPTVLCGWCSFLENCDEGKEQVAKKNKTGEVGWE